MKETSTRNNRNMSMMIIGIVVILFLIFSSIVTVFGYYGFTDAYKKEYTETTYRMADTATVLINGDYLQAYLEEELTDEYRAEYERSKANLDTYCRKIHVTMMYVIVVDTSDYGRFVCVMESVDNSVENTNYTEWERGHGQDTTNDEYRRKYVEIYENGSSYETVFREKNLNGQKAHITTLVPVKNSEGKVVAILCVHRMMSEIEGVIRKYMYLTGLTAFGMAVVAAVFYAIFIAKAFVAPIRKVSVEATRFAKENSKGAPLGAISRFKDIADLADSIEQMETDMLAHIEDLTAVTAEKERLGAELSVASAIQENSIPNVFPAFPSRKDFDVYGSMTPAKEVGGDFYNFFLIDEDHLGFTIGDVSGKGIPASLFMMATNILISDRAQMGGTPAEILSFVNDRVCEHNQVDMFVTIWLGILEISTGKITAANAGHDDAAILRKDGTVELFKSKHGLVIGAMPNLKYGNIETELQEGDKIFLYTDGVPEATDGEGKLFTIDRMLKALGECGLGATPQTILETVNAAVNAFVGDAPQFDDMTMLCVERKELSKTEKVPRTLVIDAKEENYPQVCAFAEAFLDEKKCPNKVKMQIGLALDEVFANVASYAYGEEGGKAEIEMSVEGDEIVIVVRDRGVAFDPLAAEDPDVTLSAEEREIGGLGIFLVKKTMDEMTYTREGDTNVLTIRKKMR